MHRGFQDPQINEESSTCLPNNTSVKMPNELKPGMKMSTYGGFKRRPKEDRYFEDNSSQHHSIQ